MPDRLEDWPGLFVEQCVYKITTADNQRRGLCCQVVYADSRAMLIDRVAALREADVYERQPYRHIVGMRRCAGGGDRRRNAVLVVRTMRDGRMDLFAAGVYRDRVREEAADMLRFAERIVVCDSSAVRYTVGDSAMMVGVIAEYRRRAGRSCPARLSTAFAGRTYELSDVLD